MDSTKFVYMSAVDVLDRLSSVLGTKTSHELASALGCSPQAVSGWRSRNKVPYSNCVDIAVRTGISLDWLLTGLGPVRRSPEITAELLPQYADSEKADLNEMSIAFKKPLTELSADEKELIELYRKLDKADQHDVQSVARRFKRMTELEQQLYQMKGK
ncbi:helix-turn-helix domain-containing protein [Celerinatantimonas sp. MCCC 1A17872]|uniref:helix-turn-helix domain-containing protein n=1 Tax=Celerinatantimonas sp. MCCC 1A17872 TaxID=3177514 RepID=UPI0038C487AF